MKFNTEYRIQNTEYKHSRSARKGFTMLELLIVVAITTILASVSVSSYINQQKAKLLEFTTQEIVGYLRYAQQKSVSQEQGKQWGIHFENLVEGRDFYALYSGASYTSPEETRYLPTGLEFQLPLSGNTIDISFSKLTGKNHSEAEQEIIINNLGSQIARVIRVMSNGLMTSGEGEKGYWKFDEGSGTTASDTTIYGNTGTLYNNPIWKVESNCVSGTCLEFNGSSNYVITDNIVFTGDLSMSVWVKPDTLSAWSAAVGCFQYHGGSSGTGWDVIPLSNGIKLVVGQTGLNYTIHTFSCTIPTNSWSHILVTYGSGVFKAYLNGSQVGDNWSQSAVYASSPGDKVVIGRWAWDYNGYYFDGLIDEPRIYNRALSAAEILQHYKARK